MISGDLVAGAIKGIAQGMKVVYGTDKPLKETHDKVIGNAGSDSERADAKRLRDARAKNRA